MGGCWRRQRPPAPHDGRPDPILWRGCFRVYIICSSPHGVSVQSVPFYVIVRSENVDVSSGILCNFLPLGPVSPPPPPQPLASSTWTSYRLLLIEVLLLLLLLNFFLLRLSSFLLLTLVSLLCIVRLLFLPPLFTFSAIRSIEKVLHLPKKSTSRF